MKKHNNRFHLDNPACHAICSSNPWSRLRARLGLQVKRMLGRRASRAWGGLNCRTPSRMLHYPIYHDVPDRRPLLSVAALQPGSFHDSLRFFWIVASIQFLCHISNKPETCLCLFLESKNKKWNKRRSWQGEVREIRGEKARSLSPDFPYFTLSSISSVLSVFDWGWSKKKS